MAVHRDADACADAILTRVGKRVVLGLPLGLGKANHIANALYRRAEADPAIHLRIFTALTLEKRIHGPKLLQNFAAPIAERLYGSYPDLSYAAAARAQTLPANVEVAQFYLLAGHWLYVNSAQQDYISANYTAVPRLLLDQGVNVIAQLVAKRESPTGVEYSLSCNTDLTLELIGAIETRRCSNAPIVLAGEVNDELPFMTGAAVLPAAAFDQILDSPETRFALFAPPKEPVSLAHHAIGIHIAGLIKDGGTLQIGIGQLADAIAWALILRHTRNSAFRDILAKLRGGHGDAESGTFTEGLYGVSEMFADAFLDLYRAGILRRRTPDGTLLHAAFFLGPRDFYRALREMPDIEREQFQMTGISFTNDIGGTGEAEKRAMRRHARFVNNAMIATLLGEVSSDTREDGRVVSGVGGQYNFVAQAHALEGARSIIAVNATRLIEGRLSSNIRFICPHATIPRHLRDIVVSEYGVADLRGKSDRDCVAAMLNIADSRFQPDLLREAQRAGKIEPGYSIRHPFGQNSEKALKERLAGSEDAGYLPEYPFGTDLDPIERCLVTALQRVKAASSKTAVFLALLGGLMPGVRTRFIAQGLERLDLGRPSTIENWVLRSLMIRELRKLESESRKSL